MAYQYGGWYNNPDQGGKNMRWFNGVWTNGDEPGKSGGSDNGGGGATQSIPSFSFDYAAEAEKAYGELGAYYNRLLEWSQGDMNKVLSRLTQDYETGVRIKKEDTTLAKSNIDTAQTESKRLLDLNRTEDQKSITNNALSRGLYQKSNYDPNNQDMMGFGIPTDTFNKNENKLLSAFAYDTKQRDTQKTALDTDLTRFMDKATLDKARTEEDQKQTMERNKFEWEQQRRTEAAQMANERGQQAFQNYQYSNLI